MAELKNFIYCLNAERIQTPDGKGDTINAMGVVSALTPEFVPGAFSFAIIFSILDLNINEDNKIQIIFKSKDGKELVNTGEIKLPLLPENDTNLPKEYSGLNMSMDFRNVVFEEEGVYTTQVIFNDVQLSDCSIYVKGRR